MASPSPSGSERLNSSTPGSSIASTYRSTYSRQYNVTPTPEREVPRIVDGFGNLDLSENGSASEAHQNHDDATTSSESGRILTPDLSTASDHRSTYSRQNNVTPTPERQVPSITDDLGNLDLSESGSADEADQSQNSTTASSRSERILTPDASTLSAYRSTYSRQYNVTPTPERQMPRLVDDLGNLELSEDGSADDEEDQNYNDDDLDYNLRTENLPDVPIYDARLQSALRDTKAELRELHDVMEFGPGLLNIAPNLSNLAEQTNRLSNFEYPQTRTIGLVGDSGVGKSSLINSLLDEHGIARSSGDGGACTNIVTEYRYRFARDGSNYSFEVEYMSSEEIKILLEDLVSSYRAYNTDAFREITNQAEREAVRDKAERAAAALNSLFGEHPRYSEENLSREGPDAASEIVRELEGMVTGVQQHRPGGPTASKWSATADDVDDLTNQLDVFIRMRSEDGSPVLWPFVGIIRIYLRSLFLRSGVVLADLPGLRDLNYARVRATDRYMRSCHEIFAVAKIDRVTTDVGLKDIVNRCGGRRPLRIVCTRSEDVNARETMISNRADAPRIRELQSIIGRLKDMLRRLKNQRTRNAEEILTTGEELQLAKFKLKEYLVQKRNDRVQAALRATYSGQVLNGNLQVFCVSNLEYSDALKDDFGLTEPRVKLSGIPNLRQYCQSIPAAAQFAAVAAFLDHQVPSLLGSLRQWLLQGSDGLTAERADALREALDGSRDRLSGWNVLVSALKRDLRSDFRNSIINPCNQNMAAWSTKARNISMRWMGWHHMSFSAFCRNYGDYETPKAGRHNWNDDIVSAMREDLDAAWTDFVRQASQRIDATFETISDMFEREEYALENCVELAPNAIGNLLENLGPKKDCIEDMLEIASDDFVDKIQGI